MIKEVKTNNKYLFSYISSKTKPRETIPDLKKKDGGTTEGDQEKADELNKFFGSVFTEERDESFPECEKVTDNMLSHISVTVEEVRLVLKSLKSNKSPGPDCIHPRILKELADVLAVPLKLLFDKNHGTRKDSKKVENCRSEADLQER